MTKRLGDLNIFHNFCKLNSNREEIIIKILEKESIPYTIVTLENAKHIFLYPENLSTVNNILLAHYDRVNGTPGANDNSAAVFYLLNHAKRLKKLEHNAVIIFTDKEEITSSESVTKQGAYILGKYFKSKGLKNLKFFIFDMCGIGTTLLLGKAGEELIKKHYGDKYCGSQIEKDIIKIKKRAENILLDTNGGEFFYLTPLFSDDLGLILNEYPSVLISLLPYREAVEYKKDPSILPYSWRTNHTIEDTVDTLDPKSWEALSPLLLKLSGIYEEQDIKLKKDIIFKCYTQKTASSDNVEKVNTSPISYIKEESFKWSEINSNNIDIIKTFLILSSKTSASVLEYLKSKIDIKSLDITPELYKYISNLVYDNFKLLPLKFRNSLYNLSGKNSDEALINFLYSNTISNVQSDYSIDSIPVKHKVNIKLDIDMFISEVKIVWNKDEVGRITLLKDEFGYILSSGKFNPDLLLKLDPLNMLKGIRIALIKWLKLNNNDSLRISLDESGWIGCYQFFTLIKMEMDERTSQPEGSKLYYIWKRFYGK